MARDITGNHYVNFRTDERGAVEAANVLHRGLNGLVEWSGGDEPLLRPRVRIDGHDVALEPQPDRLDRWLPQTRAQLTPTLKLTTTLAAPGGFEPVVRGGALVFELENSAGEQACEIVVDGVWQWSQKQVISARALTDANRLVRGSAGQGIALEAGPSTGGAALALRMSGAAVRYEVSTPAGDLVEGDTHTFANGTATRFRISSIVQARARGRTRVALFIGAAPERDGAFATAGQLARVGADELLRRARLELARLARRADDTNLSELLNRNLTFSFFCGMARAIDDDFLYPVSSRSPLHGPTAVVNEREALLWLLPAITECDAGAARELLLRIFEQYSDRPGHRWRYLDGGVLEPGVAQHQLCAYGLALDRFVADTGESAILDEQIVQDVLREIDELLFARLHPDIFVGPSDLLPSGEGADQPYVTFDNVMLWAFVSALERIWTAAEPPHLLGAAEEIAAAVWGRFTVEHQGAHILASSTDLKRAASIYDDPAGSLRLLPYLGFCGADDPAWIDTMDTLRSSAYPLYLGSRFFPGFAGRSHPEAVSMAGVCADLLTPRAPEAIALLQRLPLEAGLLSETFDPDTGAPVGGMHAAALSGFLAWALVHTQRVRKPARRTVRRAS